MDLVVPSWHYSFLAYVSWNLSVFTYQFRKPNYLPTRSHHHLWCKRLSSSCIACWIKVPQKYNGAEPPFWSTTRSQRRRDLAVNVNRKYTEIHVSQMAVLSDSIYNRVGAPDYMQSATMLISSLYLHQNLLGAFHCHWNRGCNITWIPTAVEIFTRSFQCAENFCIYFRYKRMVLLTIIEIIDFLCRLL